MQRKSKVRPSIGNDFFKQPLQPLRPKSPPRKPLPRTPTSLSPKKSSSQYIVEISDDLHDNANFWGPYSDYDTALKVGLTNYVAVLDEYGVDLNNKFPFWKVEKENGKICQISYIDKSSVDVLYIKELDPIKIRVSKKVKNISNDLLKEIEAGRKISEKEISHGRKISEE